MKRIMKTFFLTLLLVMSTFSSAFAEGETMEYLELGKSHTITLAGYDYETYSYEPMERTYDLSEKLAKAIDTLDF